MNTITAAEAQAKIFSLMDEVTEEREPVKITGENSNVVLISEADWNSIHGASICNNALFIKFTKS